MTKDEYKAIHKAQIDKFLAIAALLDAAGHCGLSLMADYREAYAADFSASHSLPTDVFLDILREEREARAAVLEKYGL